MHFTPAYFETQDNSAIDINKCTCQFLTLKNNVPQAHGTGVLIKVNNAYFIITAAHVIENFEEKLYVRFEQNRITRIEFELSINKINIHRKDDKTDIAILKLFDSTAQTLSGFYNFMDESELGINHQLEDSPLYLGFGYPTSQTNIHYKTKKITTEPTFFTTKPVELSIYNKLECTLDKNIIVHFNKNKFVNTLTQQLGTAPDLYGMSGGGLWYIPMQTLNPNQSLKKELVGILTEWPIKDRQFVISTRIDVITEMLRNTMNFKLPISKIFYCNFNVENI